MSTYLLELAVEEFPSRFISSTKDQLRVNVSKNLSEKGIVWDDMRLESTPRRFALFIENIRSESGDDFEIVRGPSKRVAYDESGQASGALKGFMRSKNINPADIYIEKSGKEDYVFAKIKKDQLSVEAVLSQVIPEAIRSISNPRAMRWGGKKLRFLRPIRRILSLLDDKIIEFDLDGIPVGRISRGHRFLGQGDFSVANVSEYEKLLQENYVILDEKRRRDMILRGLNKLAREHAGVPIQNEELLEEVTNIVEYPTVFIGKIPEKYLSLPKEVIITPMMDHQRYFPVIDDNKELLPYFLSVRNGNQEGIENVVAGNCKVLVARLEDARFFYEQDLKKNIEEYIPSLEELVFHEGLGTMLDKAERLEELSINLAKIFNCGDDVGENVARAARLSKADLVTAMVVEFTELQGTMGRIYALESGEKDLVAQAIEEHYYPRRSGAQLPKTTAGMVLSIADKLDSLAGLFAIGIRVSGSQDPLGLRRAVIGILDIVEDNDLSFDVKSAFREALLLYVDKQSLVFDYDELIKDLLAFFKGRIKVRLLERGIRYDVADSVLATDNSDILSLIRQAVSLQKKLDEDNNESLITSFVRLSSLAEKAGDDEADFSLLKNEDMLVYELLNRKDELTSQIDSGHFDRALESLEGWMDIVNSYLDQTMIMVEDTGLRQARLGMLREIDNLVKRILKADLIVRQSK